MTIQAGDETESVDVGVIPFRGPDEELYLLVSFQQTRLLVPREGETDKEHDECRLLRDELLTTREHLQIVIRDKDGALEELRAAYEEIQSSNEELQSINEELETAKEELQSINEELTTVNDELQLRNRDLTLAHDDLRNLLANIDVPILMLDQDLRIRSYTPRTERLLRVIPTDVGRPLSDFRLKVRLDDLEGMIRRAIDDVTPQEREARDEAGNWYSVRVRPYKTGDMRIGGAVVSFLDVSELKSLDLSRESARLGDLLSAITSTLSTEDEPKRIVAKLMKTAAQALNAPVAFLVAAEGDGWVIEQVLNLPRGLVGKKIAPEQLPWAAEARNEARAVASRFDP